MPRCEKGHDLGAIDRYFAADASARESRALFERLPDCEPCRAHFERRQLLAQLDPAAADAQGRVGAALGVRPSRSGFPFGIAAGAMAAACLCLLLIVPRFDEAPQVVPRGDGAVAQVVAYRVAGGESARVNDEIRAGDELAFAYVNTSERTHLMIFALDAQGSVFWYHPTWTDPAAPPSAQPAPRADALRELKQAVRHDLKPGPLQLFTVFMDAPMPVHTMEAKLAGSEAFRTGRIPLENAEVNSRRLEVRP